MSWFSSVGKACQRALKACGFGKKTAAEPDMPEAGQILSASYALHTMERTECFRCTLRRSAGRLLLEARRFDEAEQDEKTVTRELPPDSMDGLQALLQKHGPALFSAVSRRKRPPAQDTPEYSLRLLLEDGRTLETDCRGTAISDLNAFFQALISD